MPAPSTPDLQTAINENRSRLIDLLKQETPEKVALILEKEGWTREWACKAVRTVEIRNNPTYLRDGVIQHQKIRERLQMQVGLGAGIFIVALLISIATLASALAFGGLIVITYGAVFVGAGMFMRAYPHLKRYPDRRLPVYTPPKNARGEDPQDF